MKEVHTVKLALVGAGSRGMIYSCYAHDVLGDEIVAVADRHPEKLERAHQLFGTPEAMLFTDPMELIRTVPKADALIVASMDRDHYALFDAERQVRSDGGTIQGRYSGR